MGIFGFLKGRKADVPKVGRSEAISFGDIGKWVNEREGRLGEEEAAALDEIFGKLDEFYVSLGDKLAVLESVDLEEKKEHGRVKILVQQGLLKYIDSVHGLIANLKKIKDGNLSGLAGEIGRVFVSFERSSAKVYERATYLVGDEMMAVRNEIRRFYNGLVEMFEGALVGELKNVMEVKSKLSEIEKVESSVHEIEGEIFSGDKKIDKVNDKVGKLRKEIDEIKSSSGYISGLKDREEIRKLGVGIDDEVLRLKGLIDFKKLTNIVHSNARELQVVKDYREHFVHEFSGDKGARLFGLMEGCNMKSSLIVAKLELIERLGLELSELKGGIGKDYTLGKLKEIEGLEDESESVELENVKSGRRLDELRLRLRGLRNEALKLVNDF